MRKRYFLIHYLICQVAAVENLLRHDSSKSRVDRNSQRKLSLTNEERWWKNLANNKAQDVLDTLVYWSSSSNHGDAATSGKKDMLQTVERNDVRSRQLRRETGKSSISGRRSLHGYSSKSGGKGSTNTVSTTVQELNIGTDIIKTTTVTTTTTTTKVVTTIYTNETDSDSNSSGSSSSSNSSVNPPTITTNSTTTVTTSNNNETATSMVTVENSTNAASSVVAVEDEVLGMEFAQPVLMTISTNNIDTAPATTASKSNNDIGAINGQYIGENDYDNYTYVLSPLVLDAVLEKSAPQNVDTTETDSRSSNTSSSSSSSSSSSNGTSLNILELSTELHQAIRSPNNKVSILSGSFKIQNSCTYTTAIYADVVDYSTRFAIGEVYYVIRKLCFPFGLTPTLCGFTTIGQSCRTNEIPHTCAHNFETAFLTFSLISVLYSGISSRQDTDCIGQREMCHGTPWWPRECSLRLC
jgi:hypothetical protein